MRPIRLIAALALLALLASCASNKVRAARIADEVYSIHWGNWPLVIERATEAIEADPEFSWPYYQRGYALSRLGRDGEAAGDFEEAVESGHPLPVARELLYGLRIPLGTDSIVLVI